MQTLEAFKSGDGAHCGLTDIYPDKEAALVAALASGKPFDTGWYASKKEIATARVWSDGEYVHCEVSVSDDFDTDGMGSAMAGKVSEGVTLEQVTSAIERAWNEAEGNQKDNRQYRAYSLIHHTTKIPDHRKGPNSFPVENRKRYGRKMPQCVDYYILPFGDDDWLTGPPGDTYHYWGWQNDYRDGAEGEGSNCVEDGIPASTVDAFEKHARDGNGDKLRIGDWELKAWEDS